MSATLYCGDVRAVLAGLPERSVQCVVTSPPYFGLRDYGTASWEGGDAACDHRIWGHAPDKPTPGGRGGSMPKQEVVQREGCRKCGARRVDNQLGLERTPEEYVANMVAVFREVRRVLRDDGTVWLNLGDSYSGSPNSGGENGKRSNGQGTGKAGEAVRVHGLASKRGDGLKSKDLVGIPWRVAFALQADGWYLRSEIIWAKPNPMPESVADRPTKSHEYLFLLTKAERYYYDAQAIAEPLAPISLSQIALAEKRGDMGEINPNRKGLDASYGDGGKSRANSGAHFRGAGMNASGRNARSVWTIATQPYSGAHFATFPEEMARRCILAGSSAKACEHCGAPWERVVETPKIPAELRNRTDVKMDFHTRAVGGGQKVQDWRDANPPQTVGWQPTCGCTNTGSATSVVLDPFGGSGTTAAVATGHGRRALYIDLNPAYLELARQRIGPMLCVDGDLDPAA